MPIAFLQDGETFAPGTGTTLTISFDSGSTGSDRYLVVVVFGATTDIVTGVTYAGNSMTLLRKQVGTAQGGLYMYFYGLANPTTGTNNIVISASSSITNPPVWYGVYTGADPTQPDAYAYNSRGSGSGSFAVTLTTVLDNCWIIASEMDNNGNMAATGDCVKRTGWSAGYGVQVFDSNSAKTPAGSNSLTVTGSNGGVQDLLGISLAPKQATVISPSAQTLSLTLLSPSLSLSSSIAPSVFSLATSLLAPVINTVIFPSTLTSVISLQTPIILGGITFSPSALSLASTVQIPLLSLGGSFSPSPLSLTTATLDPTFLFGQTIFPSALDLSLTLRTIGARWNPRTKPSSIWTDRTPPTTGWTNL